SARPGGGPAITLSLHAVQRDSSPASTPRWLDTTIDRPIDTLWGVPRAWLRGLADLDRLPLPLGAVNLRTPNLALHLDGLLRLTADYPSLSGRVYIDWRAHHLDFALPSVQVVPHRAAGQLYCE